MRSRALSLRAIAATCLAAGLASAPALSAQGTITVSSTATVNVPSPRRANYESTPGESASVTATRTVSMACGNGGNCVATVRLVSTGTTAIRAVKLNYTVPSSNACQSAAGTFTRTITSTTGDSLFTAKKNQTCTATINSLSVNDLAYTTTAYRATAAGATATQTLTFGFR